MRFASGSAMSRDYKKLRVFHTADCLAVQIYRMTQRFPPSERFGLQGQIRRAALSSATNIVEGSARRSDAEYANFLNVAHGSAAEARYLLDLSVRLGFLPNSAVEPAIAGYTELMKGLNRLMQTLGPAKPESQ